MTITIPDELLKEIAKALTANGMPAILGEPSEDHVSRAVRTWLVNAILGQRYKLAQPLTPADTHDAATRQFLEGTA